MFDRTLTDDGTIRIKDGRGVPTRIQAPQMLLELLTYPRSPLDLYDLRELLKSKPSAYNDALLQVVEEGSRSWKSTAIQYLEELIDLQCNHNHDSDKENSQPDRPAKQMKLHPALQRRLEEATISESRVKPINEEIKFYLAMDPSNWLEGKSLISICRL
jgi:hypothetical protein